MRRGWLGLLGMALLGGCAHEPYVTLGPGAPGDPLAQQRALDAGLDSAAATPGNKVTLLRDGRETFPAMFRAMAAARDSIDLEYYIFEDVSADGQRLGDLLARKLAEGVAVNVIRDGYGSLPAEPAFIERLRADGANLLVFHPLDAAGALALDNPNDRDHRKIMVIDGRVGFVGGVNLDHVYENPPGAGLGRDGDTRTAFWRDTAARIDGPAVARLQRLFMDTWTHERGPALPPRDYFPKLAEAGTQAVRIVGSAPGEGRPLYYEALLTALHAAKHDIGLSTGFFVPTHQEREELDRAARRGVAVRLVLPSASDSPGALAAGRAAYGDLLEAGARIREVRDAVLHSKLAVVDDAWSVIGSSNLDRRSAVLNNEVDAIVLGHDTAAAVSRILAEDAAQASEVTLAEWRRRALGERLREWRARLVEWLL